MTRRLPTASTATSSQLPRVLLTRLHYDATDASRAGDATPMARRLPTAWTATSSQSPRVAITRWRCDATALLRAGDATIDGQAPPDGVDGDFVAIAAGDAHSLALRRDGSIACWGDNTETRRLPTAHWS
ncbi:hypothetical protein NFJ02_14g16170 [Pycnococcus provasolii]